MRQISIITALLLLIGNTFCNKINSQTALIDNNVAKDASSMIDTICHYWPVDNNIYKFDTVYLDTHYSIVTYCLNDSSIYSSPFQRENNGRNIIEYYVAHDYESKIIMSRDSIEKKYSISLETFKDSLPKDFIKIAHLWYNQFERVENNKIVIRAKVAKPDTDYQFDFLYYLDRDGNIIINEVQYGW